MIELLGITLIELQQWILILARILTLMFTIEFFSSNSIPAQMKIIIACCFSIIISVLIPPPKVLPVTFMMMIPLVFIEVAIGLAIGFSTKIIFESLQFAGFLMQRLMGLSMVTLIDPATNNKNQALGQLLYFITILLFLSADIHHFFIETIFDSFYLIPLTKGNFNPEMTNFLLKIILNIFIIGFKISAPIIAILYLQRILLALISKVNPEMNIFIVGMPLGILVGFYLMSIYWPYFYIIFEKLVIMMKSDILTMMKLIGGY